MLGFVFVKNGQAMQERDSISRTTSTADRRHFISASATWIRSQGDAARILVTAEVFFGHPSIVGNRNIYVVVDAGKTGDLLDALQSAEAKARRYIEGLPRQAFS